MPECWPGRVPLCPPSLCQAAGASGQGRRGQEGRVSSGCSLSCGTHGGWQCERRSICLSSWLFTVLVGVPCPHTAKLPGRGSWGLQWAAAMRSQGTAGGSPRQGPAWVGRGSRKVLRVWVSAWGPGGWVKPCSRGAGQVQYRPRPQGPLGEDWRTPRIPPTPQLLQQPDPRLSQNKQISQGRLRGPELGAQWSVPSPPPASLPPGRTQGSCREGGRMRDGRPPADRGGAAEMPGDS